MSPPPRPSPQLAVLNRGISILNEIRDTGIMSAQPSTGNSEGAGQPVQPQPQPWGNAGGSPGNGGTFAQHHGSSDIAGPRVGEYGNGGVGGAGGNAPVGGDDDERRYYVGQQQQFSKVAPPMAVPQRLAPLGTLPANAAAPIPEAHHQKGAAQRARGVQSAAVLPSTSRAVL